ncbi:uncharacterized protein LOC130770077 isoform X1 [Actinidia eriantha]|uniref:uncharacterized protein LOC130770077 isoform X1 n=1 Tax=Actinidia eriantha TaxID=165200 RepID=UPI00258A2698|nr:uncharacterized protein LOC130770077 isoform X1 [Actinidia eriantha]XP_057483347.1 uncharacterized protein LOC130770077 isoform X1 [Actinidia eriantha]
MDFGSQQPPYSGQSKGSAKGKGRVSDSTQTHQKNSQGKSKYWQPHGVPPMKAHWDSESTKVFLDCVARQIGRGNKPFQYLTTKGYNEVMQDFYNMTNRFHDWKQMKNKYEALKKDWGSWMRLKDPRNGCTGLGYDQIQGIFTGPDHWWEKMMTLDKNCGKFRGKTLEHSDLMEQVFGGMTATGRSQWTSGEALPSTTLIDESSGSSNEAPAEEFGVGSGRKGRTPSEEAQRGQKRANRPSSGNKSASGNKKMSAAARLSATMDKMLEVVQSQGSEVTVKLHADSTNATIGNCLQLLANLPGIDPLSPLYLLGTQLITIPANREVFMGLPNDDVRLAWLQLHRDQAAGTAPLFQALTLGPPAYLLLSWTTLMFYDYICCCLVRLVYAFVCRLLVDNVWFG